MINKSFFNKALIISVGVLIISSCSELLNTEPITDKVVPPQDEQILKTVAHAEGAMNSIYAIFGNEFWQFDYFYLGDGGADVAYAGADVPEFFQIDEYRINSTNYVIARDWNHTSDFVKRCNLLINYIDNVPDLPQDRKDEMIGQAALFRALSRFMAVQIWGDYPIINSTITSVNSGNFDSLYNDLYPARRPVAEVYDAIIADCEIAIAKAPDATFAPESKYKPSKSAAYALLAKIYATKPNPDWARVIQYCDEVMSGGFSLLATYDYLFDNLHEGNTESIWEVNGEGQSTLINSWCTNVFIGTNWKKFNTPSHTLNNALDVKRKASTIKKFPTTFSDPYWTSFTQFPHPWKMRATDGTQNFYIFRLADIILLKAEALARTGDLPGAMALVNQVRNRVSLPAIDPAISEDDAINKILQERFMELAFEGHRWFDLKRTGKSIEILTKQTYPVYDPATQTFTETPMPYQGNLTPNDLVWPIPQDILDNNPNLKQNPGY
ncbi:MAG: RagB/SusD family nutrient uptake outer membrane protein [Lewinellaceae bacterium]|nr:RagB/SusD family nutrient uptake outer membrane protein [Lewinellaceae bacterium]